MVRPFLFKRSQRHATLWVAIISLGLALAGGPVFADEWEDTLAAAKKEGTVMVWGPPGGWARKALAEAFQKSYPDIKIEYQGASGSRHWPKIERERKAGLYTVDVHIGGSGTAAGVLYRAKVLEPIEPALMLPDVKDKKNWWDGQYQFADRENKYVFVFIVDSSPAIAYNTKLVDPKQLTSYNDLLDPKWTGKIVMQDPRTRGAGNARWFFYLQSMGQDYLKKLAKQLVLTRDERQSAEWIASGKYPLATGISDTETRTFANKGAPIGQIAHLKEGANLTCGWGTANLFNRAPHPNAAKVYLNWLLSKDGQLAWQTQTNDNSARTDIAKDMVDPEKKVVKGVKYFPLCTAESIKLRRTVSEKLAKEYLK